MNQTLTIFGQHFVKKRNVLLKRGAQMNYAKGKQLLNKYIHKISYDTCTFLVPYWGGFTDHHNTKTHKHSFWELCFVVSGEGSYIEKGAVYPLKTNTLFLSKPNVTHKIESQEGLYLLYVSFEENRGHLGEQWRILLNSLFTCSPVVYLEEKDEAVSLWKALYSVEKEDYAFFLEENLNSLAKSVLLFSFSRFISLKVDLSNQKLKENDTQKIFQSIKLYIKDNLTISLTADDVANHFYISTRQLSRLFMRYEGVSFSVFKKRERLKKSANDIKNTSLSFSEIANQNGFSTLQYFSKCFTEYMESTPTEFRQMYLKKDLMRFEDKEALQLQQRRKENESD
ncbi:hypothetical protein RV11_GL002798 [Enterococcus phoeniculicola]|nr:hypothetical protein RV11_GL002798 [Enterococcus phoeniculicola]